MKIFGYDFSLSKNSASTAIVKINDVVPNVDKIPLGTKSPTRIPRIQSPVFIYTQNGGLVSRPETRRGIFEPSEYELYEIGRIEDVDSYVRQAWKKKTGLFLKEGFDYIGPNKRSVKYLKTRFAQIARATGIPHAEMIRRLARYLISHSNAFLVKVRDIETSGGQVRRRQDGTALPPVAGYFPAPPETMQVETDGSGRAIRWRQVMPNGIYIYFDAEDVVHFTFDKKEGFIFGTPTLVPVIDDIRALRTIEENIELLIYKYMFPLFQYIVGTEDNPAGYTEDGLREIDVMKQEIQFMPVEGAIVTPERHKIQAIGAEGRALRAEGYLEHFKKRVFSGLGMSAVDFGEGQTANKATSDNMSRALVDDIKDYQASFEAQFNEYVVNELLLESNFDDDMLLEENKVCLRFKEIDIDKQIKVENHAVDVFTKHGLLWDEVRSILGRDPIIVPDDPEGGDHNQYPEWFNTFWKLFHEPEKLISAVDEPYGQASQAAAQARSTALTQKGVLAAQQAQTAHEVAVAKAKKPTITRKDNFLLPGYRTWEELLGIEVEKPDFNLDHFTRSKLRLIAAEMESKLRTAMFAAFLNGFSTDMASQYVSQIHNVRESIHDRAHLLIKRLMQDIEITTKRRIDSGSPNGKLSTVRLVFDSFKYRTDFITDTEVKRAENLGKIYKAHFNGAQEGQYMIQEDTCDTCKEHAQMPVHFSQYNLSNVPPHHPNCTCGLQISKVRE